MTKNSDELILGYNYEKWYAYGTQEPITTDISSKTNSHLILTGMSGTGKSYALQLLFAKLANMKIDGSFYFADFKQDDAFSHLRDCPHYYGYDRSIEALETVYKRLHDRQIGKDISRKPITFIWDEYVANILYLQSIDKKQADVVMRKVSELLMLGRSLQVRIVISCQRPDAVVFNSGSRINFGVILALGNCARSSYKMVLPEDFIDEVSGKEFGIGEGVVLLQGSELKYIKIPQVRNFEKLKQVCIDALTRE